MVFSEVVGTLSFLQPQCDDDMADRLHYYYTTTFLLVTSVLISLKMFGGRPIECWMPAEYQHSWQEYTEIYCFSMNTYFTPFGQQIPQDAQQRENNMIAYYQWTPFFLVICAFLFYSPCLIWRILYTKSGIRLKDIVAFATDRSNIQPKMREANMKGMSAHLGSVFRHRFCWKTDKKMSLKKRIVRLMNLRFYEAYLTLLYMGIKVLFTVNVVVQVFLMNWFLQTDKYNYYGWGVLRDLLQGRPWSDSGNFPRVTYCDMDIRILGNVQKHTVQCVLVINIFTEKVFVLLWAWYTFLMLVSVFSLFSWIFSSFPFNARKQFIARRLELADVEFRRANFNEELEEFVRDYIKMDGVFVLRMLTIHAGILVCTEIVDEMWEDFRKSKLVAMADLPLDGDDHNDDEERGRLKKWRSTSPANQDRSATPLSAPLLGITARRKVSVLVPLVAAPPRADHLADYMPMSSAAATPTAGHSTRILSPMAPPMGAVPSRPRPAGFVLRTPNAEQYRADRRQRRFSVSGGPSNAPPRAGQFRDTAASFAPRGVGSGAFLGVRTPGGGGSGYASGNSLSGIREYEERQRKVPLSALATNAYPSHQNFGGAPPAQILVENATSGNDEESEDSDADIRRRLAPRLSAHAAFDASSDAASYHHRADAANATASRNNNNTSGDPESNR